MRAIRDDALGLLVAGNINLNSHETTLGGGVEVSIARAAPGRRARVAEDERMGCVTTHVLFRQALFVGAATAQPSPNGALKQIR